MRIRGFRLAAVLGAAVLMVAACTGGKREARPTPTSTGTATGTPSISPPPTRSPNIPRWRLLAPAPTARQEVAAAVVDGKIWVAGGLLASGAATARVEAYDPASNTWSRGPDLPIAVHHSMAVGFRGRLVVLGGFVPSGGSAFGPAIDRVFELRDGRWEALPRLRRIRAAGAAAVVRDAIVVVGGAGAGQVVPSEVYAAPPGEAGAWIDAADIPTPRNHLAAATDGQYVYAVGGRADRGGQTVNLDIVERYDPQADQWKSVAALPKTTSGCGAAVIDGLLVVMGGEEIDGSGSNVRVASLYDPATETWRPLPDMPRPRHGLGVVAIRRTVFALVGGTRPGIGASAVVDALEFP